LYYKNKKNNKAVSSVYQNEDKNNRYDYGKARVDISSGLVGDNEKIRDSR
jgi:hypothetical protein